MTTATRHKDFGAPVDPEALEPVSFSLYGQEFFCHPDIQGVSLLTFIRDADSKDGSKAADALLGIYRHVMPEKEYEKFDKLINSPDTVVPIDVLAEIVNWLVEVYTDRPTQEQSSSSNGQRRTGPTSGAKRSSKARQTSTASTAGTS